MRHVCADGHEPVGWHDTNPNSPCWFCGKTGQPDPPQPAATWHPWQLPPHRRDEP